MSQNCAVMLSRYHARRDEVAIHVSTISGADPALWRLMVKAAAQHDLGVAAEDCRRCGLDRAESAAHSTITG